MDLIVLLDPAGNDDISLIARGFVEHLYDKGVKFRIVGTNDNALPYTWGYISEKFRKILTKLSISAQDASIYGPNTPRLNFLSPLGNITDAETNSGTTILTIPYHNNLDKLVYAKKVMVPCSIYSDRLSMNRDYAIDSAVTNMIVTPLPAIKVERVEERKTVAVVGNMNSEQDQLSEQWNADVVRDCIGTLWKEELNLVVDTPLVEGTEVNYAHTGTFIAKVLKENSQLGNRSLRVLTPTNKTDLTKLSACVNIAICLQMETDYIPVNFAINGVSVIMHENTPSDRLECLRINDMNNAKLTDILVNPPAAALHGQIPTWQEFTNTLLQEIE